MSDCISRLGLGLNLLHHAWMFPLAMPGNRYRGNVLAGAFTGPSSRVAALTSPDLSFECLSSLNISVHQSGKWGMACSPNNGRFFVGVDEARAQGSRRGASIPDRKGRPIPGFRRSELKEGGPADEAATSHGPPYLWTVVTAKGHTPCVTLQWVYTQPGAAAAAHSVADQARTLPDLLAGLATLGRADAGPLLAARFAFTQAAGSQAVLPADVTGSSPVRMSTRKQNRKTGGQQVGGTKKRRPAQARRAGAGSGAGAGARGSGGSGGGATDPLMCTACLQLKPVWEFSKTQQKPSKVNTRRCMACIRENAT